MQGDSSRAKKPNERFGHFIYRELAMKMTTSTRENDGITIVDFRGRIVLGEESAALRELVGDLLSKGHKKILFNLGEVHYIDSSGLGSLVSALTSVRNQDGELKLLNLTNKVQDVLQITKLYTVFDIMNDEAVAVRSFGQSLAAA
jgi:anti-sigma B factor antagonist